MATKDVEDRIEQLTTEVWDHNRCAQGGTVDRKFFRDLAADIYEKAMLDAMVILEGRREAVQAIEQITGYTLQGR